MSRLILYTGPNCHLCEQAKAVVFPVADAAGWCVELVDIGDDEVLRQRYGLRIPVVMVPGGGEKGWPFTAGQVRRLMED